MKSLSSFLLLFCSVLIAVNVSAKGKDTRPNVILIMADDMGYECLNCNGGTSYATPNIDKLAKQGVRFDHCYAQPLCTPSRVKIMTGKNNFRNYEAFGYLNPKEKTFGNLFQENGYATCIAGKWQLNGISGKDQREGWNDSNRPHQFGFDEYCLWQLACKVNDGTNRKKERYKFPFIEKNGSIIDETTGGYGPDIFSDFVMDFIERKKDESFFVYYPMVLVHDPFVPTPDSEMWDDDVAHRKNNPKYFNDMMSYTDKLVGKIVQKLEELNLDENTIVLFTGDNGTDRKVVSQMGARTVKGEKGFLTDGGTHVPFVVKWPAKGVKGKVSNELISFADFYASFADLLGTNDDQDGKSFMPLLTGKKYKDRDCIVVHYDPMWGSQSNNRGRFVRNQEFKLYHDGRFYDMVNDPTEKNPLNVDQLDKKSNKVYRMLNTRMQEFPKWK